MKLQLFSVYDNKAQIFSNLWTAQTTGVAIRQFTEAANDPKHDYARHSDDFMLCCLGEWNVETAEFELLPAPNQLGLASQFIDDAPVAPLQKVN